MKRLGGFTLLEVLVALAIFALVAASVLGVSARSLQTAARLEDKTLAMWIADNQLSEMQLAPSPPGDGDQQGQVDFANRQWQWQSTVENTSEPTMRRVTVWVAGRDERGRGGTIKDRAVVTLVGFVSTEPLGVEQ
ncbi:type II secretion system minor pseudopilin GspI [Pseudomonas sp. GV071]|jgi:general secretion pathway protein I|uniref:type II secretion system minor pseudopilin GspI n=1 Tax=Pseudomonas sp. GV071 TaxID=2135754 RepID=UPI000D35AACD|nr:type II secretion system minor pseudopilin GspI [Pseudomonas sp. GV071]PTQ73754.1 general secretion pathway protein I [Pseudomonas sp. GV071]